MVLAAGTDIGAHQDRGLAMRADSGGAGRPRAGNAHG
jgi:hypothetical protein